MTVGQQMAFKRWARALLKYSMPILALGAMSIGFAGALSAGEWQADAGVTLGSYYSDNICRSRIDDEAQLVGTVRPDIRVVGEGGRLKVNLRASGEYNSLGDSDLECQSIQGRLLTNRESFVPRANFYSELEAIEDWVWLEVDARASQNPINPFLPGGDDAINAVDNANINYNYGVGARSERRVGSLLEMLVRYNYNEQYNSFNIFGDSKEHRIEAALATRDTGARLSGGVYGRFARVEFGGGRFIPGLGIQPGAVEGAPGPAFENELGSVEVRTAFRLAKSLQLNGLVGEDFNEFLTSANDNIDGTYWDVGFAYVPSERFTVGGGWGKRFFGETPRAEISYRHKRSDLRLDYRRTVTFPRNLRGGAGIGFGRGDLPQEVEDLPGDPTSSNRNPTFLGQGTIQDERFSFRWRYQARRTTMAVSASESRQTLYATGSEARFREITTTLSRTLGSHMSTDLRASWIERKGDDATVGIFAQSLDGWRASWGVSRTLGNSTTLTLRYSYTDQTAGGGVVGLVENNVNINDFEENRVDLTVRYAF